MIKVGKLSLVLLLVILQNINNKAYTQSFVCPNGYQNAIISDADTIAILKPTGVRHGDLKTFWEQVCTYINKSSCSKFLIHVHETGIGTDSFNMALSIKFIEFSEKHISNNVLLNKDIELEFVAKGSKEPFIPKAEIECISDEKLFNSLIVLNSRIQIIKQCNSLVNDSLR